MLRGGTFFFVAVALRELPPLTIVTLRLVSAIIPGTLVLHEQLRRDQIAGMTMIGFGLTVTDGRLYRGFSFGSARRLE